MPDISQTIFIGDDEAPDPGGIFIPPDPLALQFRHRTVGGVSAEADNVEFPWYWTRLNHPALNDTPQAILTVTPMGRIEVNKQTHVANLVQNSSSIGVVFRDPEDWSVGSSTGKGRWYIYNLDLQPMALRADFQIAIHEARRPE